MHWVAGRITQEGALGNVHGLRALRCYRRFSEMERQRGRARSVINRVGRNSVNSKIAGLKSCRLHRFSHVDNEIARLSGNHAASGWNGVDHSQATHLFNRAYKQGPIRWEKGLDRSPHVTDTVKIVAVTGTRPVFIGRQERLRQGWRPARADVHAAS